MEKRDKTHEPMNYLVLIASAASDTPHLKCGPGPRVEGWSPRSARPQGCPFVFTRLSIWLWLWFDTITERWGESESEEVIAGRWGNFTIWFLHNNCCSEPSVARSPLAPTVPARAQHTHAHTQNITLVAELVSIMFGKCSQPAPSREDCIWGMQIGTRVRLCIY